MKIIYNYRKTLINPPSILLAFLCQFYTKFTYDIYTSFDFYFKDFAKIVEGNMFGWDNSTAMLKSAELCGLIQRYDKQNQEKLKVRTDNYSELNKGYQEHLDEINKMLENQDNNDNVYANMAREYERDIFQSNVPKK